MIKVYCTGHCSGQYRDVGGGASAVRKMDYTGPWKFAAAPLYNPLKSPVGANEHRTTYGG